MAESFANATPLQYLHQVELLHILTALVGRVIVPPAVVSELEAGRSRGINVPDPLQLEWIEVRRRAGAAVLPIVTDLGPGQTEVLALGLEFPDSILVIDLDLRDERRKPWGFAYAALSAFWWTRKRLVLSKLSGRYSKGWMISAFESLRTRVPPSSSWLERSNDEAS